MKTLEELKKELLADGIIDAAEVKEIEAILLADGKIDTKEAEFLFDINNEVSGKANDDSWKELFVKCVTSYVLDDPNSPNEVDAEEAEWLYNKIKGDGQIDEVEKALLLNIKAKAVSFPAILEELL